MKKNNILFFTTITLALLTTIWLLLRNPQNVPSENDKPIIIGMMSGWAPFMTINNQGTYEGFDVDVAQEIANRLNRPLIIQDLGSLPSCFIALDQEKISLLLSGLDITKKRLENVTMVRYTGNDTQEFKLVFWNTIPQGITTLDDICTIADAQICVESGSSQEKFIDSYPCISKKRMPSVIDIILDLRFGKSLATVLEPRIAQLLAQKNPELKMISIKLPVNFQVFGCGIAIKKNSVALAQQITKIINNMQNDGTLTLLENKWHLND